jgi:hypothetical protein
MNRLATLIRGLPEEELLLLKKDVDEGNIARLIAERVAELDLPQKVCPTCQAPLDDDAPFVLYFGTGVRKKARFDGRDCLQQFLDDLE